MEKVVLLGIIKQILMFKQVQTCKHDLCLAILNEFPENLQDPPGQSFTGLVQAILASDDPTALEFLEQMIKEEKNG